MYGRTVASHVTILLFILYLGLEGLGVGMARLGMITDLPLHIFIYFKQFSTNLMAKTLYKG